MVAPRRKAAGKSQASGTPAVGEDVLELLAEDHRKVSELFEEYEASRDDAGEEDKVYRVATICLELIVHSAVEEEIFYPAARDALGADAEILNQAEVEHASLKYLIGELGDMQPSDPLYDAHVKVLFEYVKHHVEEEEGEIFPALRDSDLDLEGLGREVASRKQELQDEYQAEEASD